MKRELDKTKVTLVVSRGNVTLKMKLIAVSQPKQLLFLKSRTAVSLLERAIVCVRHDDLFLRSNS